MYFCPECDEGPFNPQDWWEHFHSHNIPWLRGRNPKNLERTDLGYGEDLNRTTVPTHDMPNEWHNLTNPPFDGGLSTDPPGAHMGAQWIDRDAIWDAYPNANDYFDVHGGSHPFIYVPSREHLEMGKPGTSHMDLMDHAGDLYQHDNVWGRYFPSMNGGVDIFDPETNDIQDIDEAMGAIRDWERKRQAAQTIPDAPVTPTPKAHRMVWLSQPNNNIKWWHHHPTNTTYAWDYNNKHHIDAIPDVVNAGGEHYRENPTDWDGGFWANEMGRHPADLWGLPSQVDYAPVQGDGDYGMF